MQSEIGVVRLAALEGRSPDSEAASCDASACSRAAMLPEKGAWIRKQRVYLYILPERGGSLGDPEGSMACRARPRLRRAANKCWVNIRECKCSRGQESNARHVLPPGSGSFLLKHDVAEKV